MHIQHSQPSPSQSLLRTFVRTYSMALCRSALHRTSTGVVQAPARRDHWHSVLHHRLYNLSHPTISSPSSCIQCDQWSTINSCLFLSSDDSCIRSRKPSPSLHSTCFFLTPARRIPRSGCHAWETYSVKSFSRHMNAAIFSGAPSGIWNALTNFDTSTLA